MTQYTDREVEDEARKQLGAPPYDDGTNYVRYEGYHARSCAEKFGADRWEAALEKVEREFRKYRDAYLREWYGKRD